MLPAKTLTPEGLQKARRSLCLSRKDLAGRIGVDYLTVRRWEQPGVVIPRMAEVAFTAVMMARKQEIEDMTRTLDQAIEFARKHGMKVEEVGDRRLKVTYPSGESRVMDRDNSDTPVIITDMACNLL